GYNSGITRKFYVDDREVTDGLHEIKKDFKVVEKYTLTGFDTEGDIAEVSYTFVFDLYGNTVTYTDIYALETVDLQDIMFVMAAKVNGTYSNLIPKSIPFTQDSVNYDFSSPYDMTGFAPVNSIQITPARAAATGIFCDRVISIKDEINFHIGFIPVQAAEITARRTNAARK